jgi:hypothetical protein
LIFPNQDFESGTIGDVFIDGGVGVDVVRYDAAFSTVPPNTLRGGGSGGNFHVLVRNIPGAYTDLLNVAEFRSLRLEFDVYMDRFGNGVDLLVQWSSGRNVWFTENWNVGSNRVENQWNRAMAVFDVWAAAGRPNNIAIRLATVASGERDNLYFDNAIFIGVDSRGQIPDDDPTRPSIRAIRRPRRRRRRPRIGKRNKSEKHQKSQ